MFTTALTFLQIGGQEGPEGPGIVGFFLQAGPMAKFILAVLILFSLGSWAIIFGKLLHFRRADQQSEKFLEAFAQRCERWALRVRVQSVPVCPRLHDHHAAAPTDVGRVLEAARSPVDFGRGLGDRLE